MQDTLQIPGDLHETFMYKFLHDHNRILNNNEVSFEILYCRHNIAVNKNIKIIKYLVKKILYSLVCNVDAH